MRAVLGLAAVALLAAAPAAAESHRAPSVGQLTGAQVLLFPLDVKAYELARGGTNVARAERTDNAREWVRLAVERLLPAERASVTTYAPPSDPERNERHAQALSLQKMVGAAVIAQPVHHRLVPTVRRQPLRVEPGARRRHPP